MKTKSKKAKAESANYLDYVPMHNEDKYPFQTDDNGAVTIMVENKGVFNKIAQVVFRKPRISKIHLDEMGNFIWPYIDGARTIYDISELLVIKLSLCIKDLYNILRHLKVMVL